MKVYIIKGKDPYKVTKELLGKMKFSLRDKKVFIKANVHPNKIASTDVNVVKAILEKLKNCDVAIGGNIGITGKPFIVNNYDKLAKEFNAKLIDLDMDEKIIKKVRKPIRFNEFPIAKSVLDSEYIINAAKLKIHSTAKVTLCLKNLFGCIPGRIKVLIHPFINDAIHDYMQIFKSDLNIIDGIVGNQNDECIPNPVRSDIIIGGYDALSVDIVGTRCMDIDPEEVKYLKLLNYENKKIEVIGEKIEDVKKKYNRIIPVGTYTRHFIEDGIRTLIKLNLLSK
jgi:uncharacterized protein (DUF362 family)